MRKTGFKSKVLKWSFLAKPQKRHFRAVSFWPCLCSAGLKMHRAGTLGGACTLVNFELSGLQRRPEYDFSKNAILAIVGMDLQNHSKIKTFKLGL